MALPVWLSALFTSGIFQSIGQFLGTLTGGGGGLTETELALQEAALREQQRAETLKTILVVGGIGAGVLLLFLLLRKK